MDNKSEECPSQVENENISVKFSSGSVVFSTSKLFYAQYTSKDTSTSGELPKLIR